MTIRTLPPRSIVNHSTGDRLYFLTSPMCCEGESLEFRCTLPPLAAGAPLHSHADMDEWFIVERGQLAVDLGNGVSRLLGPGDAIELPAGTPHGFANAIDAETVFRARATPGLEIERFLRMIYRSGITAPAGRA